MAKDLLRIDGLKPQNAEEAREKMLAWANGDLSHWNAVVTGSDRSGRHDNVDALTLIADAAEATKWAAVYQALLSAESVQSPIGEDTS